MTARLAPEPWSRAGVEPRVDDLINDPIVALVMRRDNLTASDLLEVAVRARALLRQPGTWTGDPDSLRARPSRIQSGVRQRQAKPCD
jgi:uncharacterized protein (DUF1800 family)